MCVSLSLEMWVNRRRAYFWYLLLYFRSQLNHSIQIWICTCVWSVFSPFASSLKIWIVNSWFNDFELWIFIYIKIIHWHGGSFKSLLQCFFSWLFMNGICFWMTGLILLLSLIHYFSQWCLRPPNSKSKVKIRYAWYRNKQSHKNSSTQKTMSMWELFIYVFGLVLMWRQIFKIAHMLIYS